MFSARSRRVSTLQRHETTPSVGLHIDVVGTGGAARSGPWKSCEVDAVAAREFVKPPGVGLTWVTGERRTHSDDETHHFRRLFGEFARIKSAKTPSDDTDGAFVLGKELAQSVMSPFQHALAQPEVEALTPTQGCITARPQEAAQKGRACVACSQSRKHEHRVPVAFRRSAPDRAHRQTGVMFPERPHLEQLQQQPRRRVMMPRRMCASAHSTFPPILEGSLVFSRVAVKGHEFPRVVTRRLSAPARFPLWRRRWGGRGTYVGFRASVRRGVRWGTIGMTRMVRRTDIFTLRIGHDFLAERVAKGQGFKAERLSAASVGSAKQYGTGASHATTRRAAPAGENDIQRDVRLAKPHLGANLRLAPVDRGKRSLHRTRGKFAA